MLKFLFILCVLAASCSLYITKDENSRKNKKIRIISFAEILIGVLIAGFSYYNDFQSDKQHNRIEKFDSLNNVLSEKIKSLSLLNNSIAVSSHSLEIDNKYLAIRNSKLSDSIKYVVNSIKHLTNQNNKLTALIRHEARNAYLENLSRGTLVFNFKKPVNSIKDITFSMATGTLLSPVQGSRMNQGTFPFEIGELHNKVFLNAEVIDQNNNHIVSIENNNWIVNPHVINRLNYDNNGFEVIDDMSNVLFSIDIFPDNRIKFQGFIFFKDIVLVIGDKEITFVDNVKNFKEATKYFKRLFVYTGTNWLHKRANYLN